MRKLLLQAGDLQPCGLQLMLQVSSESVSGSLLGFAGLYCLLQPVLQELQLAAVMHFCGQRAARK